MGTRTPRKYPDRSGPPGAEVIAVGIQFRVILLCIGVTAALYDAHTKILQVYLSGALFREIPVSTCAKLRGIAETVKDFRAVGYESVSSSVGQ
jgi:hypothetical protein